MTLARFKGRRSGPAVLLANGVSVLDHDLARISVPVVSMNMSHTLRWPDYHVCLEKSHAERQPETYARLAKEGKLFVAGSWEIGHVIPLLNGGPVKFSRDLTEGVVTQIGTVGSVFYAALQVAAYLGFGPLFALGLDLTGPHFHLQWPCSPRLSEQANLFRHVPSDVKVYNVGSPNSRENVFERMSFDQMLEAL